MDIKERIIFACSDLAKTKGFYNLTMDELSAQAGVSKRTVYRYFRSKEEIIEATVAAFMQDVNREVERILAEEQAPEEMFNTLVQYLFIHGRFITSPSSLEDLRRHYPDLWQKIDRFRLGKIKLFIEAVMSKNDKPALQEIDPSLIASIIQVSVQAIINPDYLLSNHLDFETTVSQLKKFWLTALF